MTSIYKVIKYARADTSLPARKIVVHSTQGVSDDVRKWFAAKAAFIRCNNRDTYWTELKQR